MESKDLGKLSLQLKAYAASRAMLETGHVQHTFRVVSRDYLCFVFFQGEVLGRAIHMTGATAYAPGSIYADLDLRFTAGATKKPVFFGT